MLVYHISKLENPIEKFVAKVPNNRLSSENSTIDRICVSDSIEGCLRAVPWCGVDFIDIFNKFYYSIPFRVYEFDLDDIKEFYTPNDLVSKGYVKDALITNEYWILDKEIKPRREYIVEIRDFETGYYDNENSSGEYLKSVRLNHREEKDFLILKNIGKNIELNKIHSSNVEVKTILEDIGYDITKKFNDFNEIYGFDKSIRVYLNDDLNSITIDYTQYPILKNNLLIDIASFKEYLLGDYC